MFCIALEPERAQTGGTVPRTADFEMSFQLHAELASELPSGPQLVVAGFEGPPSLIPADRDDFG